MFVGTRDDYGIGDLQRTPWLLGAASTTETRTDRTCAPDLLPSRVERSSRRTTPLLSHALSLFFVSCIFPLGVHAVPSATISTIHQRGMDSLLHSFLLSCCAFLSFFKYIPRRYFFFSLFLLHLSFVCFKNLISLFFFLCPNLPNPLFIFLFFFFWFIS